MKRVVFGAATLALLWGGVAAAPVQAGMILLLSTGNAAEDSAVSSLLAARGQSVTVGPDYTTFTGAGLSAYNAVLLLPNYNWPNGDMPAAGQSALLSYVQGGGGLVTSEWLVALLSYVQGGGGLVTSEWLVWKAGAQTNFQTLQGAIPVVPASRFGTEDPITYTQAAANPALNQGVLPSFTFAADNIGGTETFYAAKPGATVFYGSSGGAASGAGLVGWNYVSGKVLSFSTMAGTTELGDPNYAQLFGNAVLLAEVVPAPSGLILAGLGAFCLAGYVLRRRSP
jgi:hypothetical protein